MKNISILERYQSHPDFIGTDLHDVNQIGSSGDAALHIACRRGRLEDIDGLITLGANFNQKGDLGNSPLHYAALAGQTGAAEKLVKLGADQSLLNDLSQTALEIARMADHKDIVALLK